MFGWLNKTEEVKQEEVITIPTPIPEIAVTSTITEIHEEVHEKLPNPGKFEEITRECKEITGTHDCFDGLKLDISKTLGERFQIAHSLALGASGELPSYNFSGTFVGGMDETNTSPRVMLNGRINTDGQLIGRCFYSIAKQLTLRLTGQTMQEPHNNAVSAELDYNGDIWQGQFKWVSPGTYGVSYHQSITKRLSLGCDLFFKYSNAFAASTIGGRYSGDKWIGTAVYNPAQLALSYTRSVSNNVGLSTELTFGAGEQGLETLYTMGFEYRLRHSLFRGHVDSTAKVYGYLEESLNEQSRFILSAELDHKKKAYKFGAGLSLNL